MFASVRPRGFDPTGLKRLLLIFFISLLLPTLVLVLHAYDQLKWQAFHQHRQMAQELAARIDGRIAEGLAVEEARSFGDYSFLVLEGEPKASFLQRSPLSNFPVTSPVAGLLGYFQLDSQGQFTTPLLPSGETAYQRYGISRREYARRLQLEQQVLAVLSRNSLVSPRAGQEIPAPASEAAASSEAARGQEAFDELLAFSSGRAAASKSQPSLGRVEDLELDRARQPAPVPGKDALARREKRTEHMALAQAPSRSDVRITTFESEIDPFAFRRLDSGHFVLFRKVWRDGQRTIQGAVIEQQAFVRDAIDAVFSASVLSSMSQLLVAYRGDVLSVADGVAARDSLPSSAPLRGELLYQTRLSAPVSELELLFTVTHLPTAAGSALVVWLAVLVLIVLSAGCYAMYRLGMGQIAMVRQQQDFVSAVSHELKTPLTSIQMYSEMLRAGWADEARKQSYYDYIYDESERLSRLINNVLQLARMTRNETTMELKSSTAGELLSLIESKITSQLERTGFVLELQCDPRAREVAVQVDVDGFTRIFINLVDNAIKFSAVAERKEIVLACRLGREHTLVFSLRDYGPGIPRDQLKKIFRLFYRSENELTRETVGTGIGLALAQQLVQAMGGRIDVINRQPGAEFSVVLPQSMLHPGPA